MKKRWRIRIFDGSGGDTIWYTADVQPEVLSQPDGRLVVTYKDEVGPVTIYVSAHHTVGICPFIEGPPIPGGLLA